MAETFLLTPVKRAEYVRVTALSAFFADKQHNVPRYRTTFKSSPEGFEGLARSVAELVTRNLRGLGRISDQRWQRIARAQFAFLDQDLVDDAAEVPTFVEAFQAGDYQRAAGVICPWLEDRGYCISNGNTGGTLPRQGPLDQGPPILIRPLDIA
ncbi:hypothetical protein [Hyphomonas chukchiensis]|uniref:Uncharacterized protein n=1 Tax=Hyphomonas chukchiensis TaxID=1280947 RepID=A0A062UKQ5_9PROT|nr:hypothetical protein [Hyphomonas chukchiensis]KCZ56665.1 hypothetical protein HY30_06000 [Hyphomonas chukchiensis]